MPEGDVSGGPVLEVPCECYNASQRRHPLNPKSAQAYRQRKAPSGVKEEQLDGWSFASTSVIESGASEKWPYTFLMIIDAQTLNVLQDIEAFGHANDAKETDRARRMLNLERSTAELVQILVLSSGRKRILEIGSSNGYSALWLGAALRAIPGAQSLVTIERDADRVQQARSNIAKAGLSEMITVREGSATEIIRTLPGPFDCVFFDADRFSAPEQLHLLLPKLEPDVLLLADNIISHPDEVAGYLAEFEFLPEFVTTTAPVGKGLHIAHRGARAGGSA